jgi:hypothetical protein
LACHLQIDPDPVPDPAYQFGADPDPDLFDADADPGYQNDADPNLQHCFFILLSNGQEDVGNNPLPLF